MSNEKFEYFIDQTNQRLKTLDDTIRDEFTAIRNDIRELDRFQWKQVGGYVLMSVIAGGIGSFVLALIERGGK